MNSIDKAFRGAMEDGAFPAAEVLVSKDGEIVYSNQFGGARKDTCFDIASLTKPVSTATLAMFLVAQGLLKLDDNVYQWLAGAREPHHKIITVRHLLNHTSGLPAWQPFYRELPLSLIGTDAGKRFILDSCYNEPLITEIGTKTIYSDLGYIILGEIIEQAGSATLDALFSQHVARPLLLKDTFFVRTTGALLKTAHKEGEHRRFAPTEDCPWRKRVIHGEVHDQNAYALGGVAGHAGLFSTAGDLNIFITELIKAYHGKSDWLPKNIVRDFLQEASTKPVENTFALGWNRPSKHNSSSGHYFSANSIGHSGYTGGSIWIDLDKNFWIILLTNRIHPSTTNEKIKSFRPKIHDLIYKELIR